MNIEVVRQLVLTYTGDPTPVFAFSESFELPMGDNAFEAEGVIIKMTGTNATLCIGADVSNDDENWDDLADLCEITAVGLVVAPVYSLAVKKCRLRFDFKTDDTGVCVLAARIRTTSL